MSKIQDYQQAIQDFVEKESLRAELREMDAENTRLLDEVAAMRKTLEDIAAYYPNSWAADRCNTALRGQG